MGRGFYNNQMGYWETNTSDVDDVYIKQYPQGTIETPPRPDNMSEFNGTEWVKITPSTNPKDYPLTALEFEAALVRLGIDHDQVAPAIKQVYANDTDARADSLARWRRLKSITYDNEVMALLKPVFNVTDEQINAAWMATVARRKTAK